MADRERTGIMWHFIASRRKAIAREVSALEEFACTHGLVKKAKEGKKEGCDGGSNKEKAAPA